MNEKDILDLIKNDEWAMNVLSIAETLNLPQWAVGAGFVRNRVWNYLHGYSNEHLTKDDDIDLVYYDPSGNDEIADEQLTEKLKRDTGLNWEIVNQSYAHEWNKLPPYKSTEDALSQWPETATGIGVTTEKGKLKLIAPNGIEDLVNLVIRPSPKFYDGVEKIKQRTKDKKWLEKWPRLKVVS